MPGLTALPKREPAEADELESSRPTRSLDSLIVEPSIRKSLLLVKMEQRLAGQLAMNGLPPRHKLVFHGPPGNGKTASAEALAALLDRPLYTARVEEMTNSYHGESEKSVVRAFRAVAGKKCVLFFDEADSLLGARFEVRQSCDAARNNCTNLCLQQLDQLDARVLFIAATNRFDDLDPAVKRRFDESLYFAPPTAEQRGVYLEAAIERMPIFKKPQYKAAAAEARRLDAPSFAQLEQLLKNLARELILKSLR